MESINIVLPNQTTTINQPIHCYASESSIDNIFLETWLRNPINCDAIDKVHSYAKENEVLDRK